MSSPVTAFVDVAVIPMDRERVLTGQSVLVRGERIIALGPVGELPIPPDAIRVDGRGRFLLPGLADMHAHFGGPGGRGGVVLDTAALFFSYVANGVTTVRDMHSGPAYQDGRVRGWMPVLRQRVASGELLGPRLYLAGDADQVASVSAKPATMVRSIEALKAAGYDFLKFTGDDDQATYDSVIAVTRRVGLPIVGHALGAAHGTLADALSDHWASVEHLLGYFTYATGLRYSFGLPWPLPPRVNDATLRKMAQATKHAGVWNCPTLVVKWVVRGAPDSAAMWDWEEDFDRRLVKALHDAGAGLLLGTDAAPLFANTTPLLFGGFAVHRELEMLVDAGLTPYQALETGTRNVARFLGTEDSTGTVAVGKRADLILLKANPLTDIRHVTALAGVMVGGRWLSRKTLEQQISSMQPIADPDSKWGTAASQIGFLSQVIWR